MNRHDFRSWGIGLPPAQFARALGTLGVLRKVVCEEAPPKEPADVAALLVGAAGEGERLEWEGSFDPAGPWVGSLSPQVLVKAWGALDPGGRRLEVLPLPGSALWLLSQLGRPEVGLRSVYLRSDLPPGDASWQWPLRVGLLAGDLRSSSLRALLDRYRSGLMDRLTRPVMIGAGFEEECDLLLLPQDLPGALAAVLNQARSPMADAVVVLGSAGPDRRAEAQLRALRETVPGSGVAVVPLPHDLDVFADLYRRWLGAVVESLSHDSTLDRALFNAARTLTRIAETPLTPLLLFARRLADFDLSTKTLELAERLEEPELADLTVEVPDGTALGRYSSKDRSSPGEVGELLRRIHSKARYVRERDGAEVVAEVDEMMRRRPPQTSLVMGDAKYESLSWRGVPKRPVEHPRLRREPVEEAGEPTAPPAPGPRHLLAQVLEADLGGAAEAPGRPQPAFVADLDHEIRVWIGPPDGERNDSRNGGVFPEERLPEQATPHTLTVVFSEPSLLANPQVATLQLPRRGTSTPCSFWLRPPAGSRRVEARLVVLHRNRVLQTARLTGAVTAPGEEVGGEDRWHLDVEAEVRVDMAALEARRSFDAALVLNRDSRGVQRVTLLRDDRAEVRVADLDELIRWFDRQISEVAYQHEGFADGLHGKNTQALLRLLARKGSQLYEHLVCDQWGRNHPIIEHGVERLQVISAYAGGRLPLEMAYDQETPERDAPLCPHAEEALERGQCCGVGSAEQASRICPYGFWGISRVIERQVHDPAVLRGIPADFVVQPEGPGRRALQVLGPSLIAASRRVDKTAGPEWKALQEKIPDLLGAPTSLVDSWDRWPDALRDTKPHLHLLLVHTDIETASRDACMEIGKGSWLALPDLRDCYVRSQPDGARPLVILLGCETASPDIDFLGFPAVLMRRGAAVVLCAQSTIHAVHAVPVTLALLETLRQELQGDGRATLGEVMRSARRKLLAQGLPMVLCLLAFGDADWELVASMT